MTAHPNTEEALARPLHLSRICVEKVWGGRALEGVLGIELECTGPVGETWELADRDDHNSIVAEGRFEGQSLHWLMANERQALLGDAEPSQDDQFPLLVKFLSAEKPLSVQVHPDQKVARKLGNGEAGKNEAWYILSAEPESLLYLGLRPEVGPAEFAAAAGSMEVVDLLQTWSVKPGQFVWVPAGTVHAIGAGITLLEVQQNSDATYRIFDWGRLGLDGQPRRTHVEEALLAANYDYSGEGPVVPELQPLECGNQGAELVDNEFFRMELVEVCGTLPRESIQKNASGTPLVIVCVAGAGTIGDPGGESREFVAGDTWLIPAVVQDWTVESRGGECRLILVEAKAQEAAKKEPQEESKA